MIDLLNSLIPQMYGIAKTSDEARKIAIDVLPQIIDDHRATFFSDEELTDSLTVYIFGDCKR